MMSELQGRWLARTPFGAIELVVENDGSFELAGRRGRIEVDNASAAIAGSSVRLPLPQGDSWWIPLPDSGGVLRFDRLPAETSRSLDFPSGLKLSVPADWRLREVPGALSIHPPSADRPGLPPGSFIEIYESLTPLEEELLLAAMVAMLRERGANPVDTPPDQLQIANRTVHRFRGVATPPTGEKIDVQLWVTRSGDHILALAQANVQGELGAPDEVVEGILQTASFIDWGRDSRLVGRWEQSDRRPSGPLTEVVERRLTLSEDGTYTRERTSLLEVPEGTRPPEQQPRETKRRIGLWYTRKGHILLSAGLQGYRVQELGWEGDQVKMDGNLWSSTS